VTPTQVSNMVMIAGLEKNERIKNDIVKIANEKAKKINQKDETKEEEVSMSDINTKTTTSKNTNIDDDMDTMSIKDIWDMFK